MVSVHCTDVEGQGWHTFPLDELVSAGPVNDTVRVLVAEMGKALVHDAIGQAIKGGALPGFDTFQSAAAAKPGDEFTYADRDGNHFEGVVIHAVESTGGEAYTEQDAAEALEVHRLQPASEYVMDGNGPHAEAVGFEPPEGDDGFGQNGS
jgi:hypothetical protein